MFPFEVNSAVIFPLQAQDEGSVIPHAGWLELSRYHPLDFVTELCCVSDADGKCPFLPVRQVSYLDHSAPITHCKFSPNATQVASVDTDGRMM